ncbi:MAG TPA: flagellar basal body P-ring formation chaperone FlgA [Phenylobacterium sp.]|nr:flagellar basal body P-ring formation chaperone FlgA [Phenylobacterium sp.]HQP20419.1 flagellar basal body P-ring formation chaperone FlgA [Phenylobacterium sp.]
MRAPTLGMILGLALTLAAAPALAGQSVTLRPDTTDADGVVTLGDLFEGAGAAANVAIAQRSGTMVVLDANAVQAAARRAGLDWANATGLRSIVVKAGEAATAAGPARGNVEVLTYARSLSTGEMVQPEDLVWAKVAAAPADAPRDADAVIGQSARRPLRQGAAVSLRDVAQPLVIKTGDVVTVSYEADGISLSIQGKALANGAIGDTLLVQNPTSKKTLQAVVTGPGLASIGPAADQARALGRSQIALR